MSRTTQGGARLVALLRLALDVAGRERLRLGGALALGACDVGFHILLPLAGARVLDALREGDADGFQRSLWLMAGVILGQGASALACGRLCLGLEERGASRLRLKIATAIFGNDLAFFERHWVGDLVSRTLADSAGLKGIVTGLLLQSLFDAAAMVVVGVLLVRMDPILAMSTILAAPLTSVVVRRASSRLEALARRLREAGAGLTGVLQAWLSQAQGLKAHALETVAERRFARASDDLAGAAVAAGWLGTRLGAVSGVLLAVPSLLVFAWGGRRVLSGDLSIGHLFAFMSYASYFNAPIQRFTALQAALPGLLAVHDRVREILDAGLRGPAGGGVMTAAASPPPAGMTDGPIQAGMTPAGLMLEDVEFGFTDGGSAGWRLRVPAFVARRGEIVGLAGPNGSGKSTLLKLMAGLYAPDSGRIFIAGAPAGDRRRMHSRRQERPLPTALLMSQNCSLFDGTLLENVTLFDPAPDLGRLDEVARQTGLAAWVQALPDGWRTTVNPGLAATWSGGEERRIELARALYRSGPVRLLDEPSAGLDADAIRSLRRLLAGLKQDSAVVLATHREDLLADCDRLYRLRAALDGSRLTLCLEKEPAT